MIKKTINKILYTFLLGSLCFAIEGYAAKKKKKKTKARAAVKWSRPYGTAGCGLGSAVMGKGGGQIFASTTNGTLWSKYFGITSGILNCIDPPKGKVASKMDQFIHSNRNIVFVEMVRGSGEHIDALASLLECKNKAAFGKLMKDNFTNIYQSQANTMELTDSIISAILYDQTVLNDCKSMSSFNLISDHRA